MPHRSTTIESLTEAILASESDIVFVRRQLLIDQLGEDAFELIPRPPELISVDRNRLIDSFKAKGVISGEETKEDSPG